MRPWILSLLVAAGVSAHAQEEKPVPKDSLRIVANGCLKGRVFKATSPATGEDADVVSSPDVSGRSFRLAGPRPVMDDVKKHDGHLVKVVGVVLKSSLADNAPGARVGNTRIVVGSPRSMDPAGRPPMPGVAIMDVTSVLFLAESCKP
jgi:hypothetical protein